MVSLDHGRLGNLVSVWSWKTLLYQIVHWVCKIKSSSKYSTVGPTRNHARLDSVVMYGKVFRTKSPDEREHLVSMVTLLGWGLHLILLMNIL